MERIRLLKKHLEVRMLSRLRYIFFSNRLLKNIQNRKKNKKRALVCYTVTPFLLKSNDHSNIQESKIIIEVLDSLGYTIDIIHYTSKLKINYSKYDLIFGFGNPYEKSFRAEINGIKRIYYATGAHFYHQNNQAEIRTRNFNLKNNSALKPERIVSNSNLISLKNSDHIIVIGNSWTISTYHKHCDIPIHSLNATAIINSNSNYSKRDIKHTKNNYLWFGSLGNIHKGLDLCVDYFAERNQIHLHICGPISDDFLRIKKKELSSPNIHIHGFVKVDSEKFTQITSECLFTILPSCSEGQATSLLTTMATGLIPIATIYTGIDISKFGIEILSLTTNGIHDAILKSQRIDINELIDLSKSNAIHVEKFHSQEHFRSTFQAILNKCL